MKAKRFLITLFLVCSAVVLLGGCMNIESDVWVGGGSTTKNEFENKEITKIETSWVEGFAPFPGYYLRTFDFKNGEVCDTLVTDEDVLEILEHTDGFAAEDFNNPKQVATFTEEQATALYDKIKSLGFFTWKEEYATDDIICDGGSQSVGVFFADGTVKSTSIYYEYPPKYNEIRKAFEEYLGVTFYLGW